MADILSFQPEEYEILEEFTFEEEIQRPDELRFFTLDEQLLDYFEKVLPVGKKISKADYKRISKEVDRIRTVYQQSVTVTDSFSKKRIKYSMDTKYLFIFRFKIIFLC